MDCTGQAWVVLLLEKMIPNLNLMGQESTGQCKKWKDTDSSV